MREHKACRDYGDDKSSHYYAPRTPPLTAIVEKLSIQNPVMNHLAREVANNEDDR